MLKFDTVNGLASIIANPSRRAAEMARLGRSIQIAGQESLTFAGLLAVAEHLGDQGELIYVPTDADRVSYYAESA